MFLELFNNRQLIFKNYSKLLYNNRKWIFIFIGSFFLLLIYALISIKEYKLNIQNKYNSKYLESEYNFNTNYNNFNKQLEGYKNFDKDKNNNNPSRINNDIIYSVTNNKKMLINLNFITDKNDRLYKSLISYIVAEYLVYMDSVNITSRGFNNITDISKKYKQELLSNITNTEKEYLTDSVNYKLIELNANKQKWLLNILEYCKFTKGQKWLEMGMPHTHSNVIIFSDSMFSNFNWSTFIHECVHIDQRKYIYKYYELYNKWGFIYTNISIIKGIDSIITKNRLNPDAIDCNWLWNCPLDNNYYWIGAIFNSITPSTLDDVSYISLKIEKDNQGNYYYNGSDYKYLNTWNEFQTYFSISNNQYHPNEIIAEYMSIYFEDKLNNIKLKNITGYTIFINWFSKI